MARLGDLLVDRCAARRGIGAAADLQASIPGAAQSRGESLGFHATYQPLAGSQRQNRALVLSTPSRGRGSYLSLIHISEPTRLGMISYAVFCLKKKKKT